MYVPVAMVSNFHQVLSKEKGLAEDEALPLSSCFLICFCGWTDSSIRSFPWMLIGFIIAGDDAGSFCRSFFYFYLIFNYLFF